MKSAKTVTPLRLLAALAVAVVVVAAAVGLVRVGSDGGDRAGSDPGTAAPSDDVTDDGDGDGDRDGDGDNASGSGLRAPRTLGERVALDQLRPQPDDARADRPDLYADECQVGPDDFEPTSCAYGVPASEARATIAVVGDSKAGQWATALQDLAQERRWRILILTKSACAANAARMSRDGGEYVSCTRYNRRVDKILRSEPVDLILTSSSSDVAFARTKSAKGALQAGKDLFVRGERVAWDGWIEAGNRVAVISDIPRPNRSGGTFDMPSCVEKYADDIEACTFDRESGEAMSAREGQLRGIEESKGLDVSAALADEEVPGAADAPLVWIDPVPLFCTDDACPPNDGKVLVYREGSHLTATYVSSLAARIGSVMTSLGLP